MNPIQFRVHFVYIGFNCAVLKKNLRLRQALDSFYLVKLPKSVLFTGPSSVFISFKSIKYNHKVGRKQH